MGPYDLNSDGPGMYRDQNLKNYTFTFDWRITNRVNLNLAHNYQHTDLRNPALTGIGGGRRHYLDRRTMRESTGWQR